MKALAIVHRGLEKVSADELKRILGCEASAGKTVITFDVKKPEDFCTYAYMARSVKRVLCLLGSFDVKADLETASANLNAAISKAPLLDWTGGRSFKVICERNGEHNFSSQDLAAEAGAQIKEITKCDANLKNPDVTFFVYVFEGEGYFGVDLAGELGKRDYRIMPHPNDVKGSLAFAILMLAGYTGKESLLDPFAHSGTFAIEAALFASNKSVNYYRKESFSFGSLKPFEGINCIKIFEKLDRVGEKAPIHAVDPSMRNLKAAEKNAKVAGINKLISFSKMDLAWLDTKFGKGEIQLVVSHPVAPSRSLPKEKVEKLYKELFYQLEYIIAAKGSCTFLTKSPELLKQKASEHFSIAEEIGVWSGSEALHVLRFTKIK
ncbi:hypothetical protein JXB11_04795 [Candidatus Woesearchaeota archaeon]|nr:hypothetical protein [Candidatus Woesearchaeota archaeon]